MAHVFISYKHEDGDFAELLKGRLEKEGFETWMDTDIQGGEKWSTAIDQAIENALALIVVMSPEARKSDYITYEWSFALGLKKPVVPILLRSVDLHPKLAEILYIDFSNRNARPWATVYERIKKIVADAPKVQLENNTRHPQNLDGLPEHVKRAIDVLHDEKYFYSFVHEEPNPLHIAVDHLASSQHSVAQAELLQALEHANPDVRRVTALILGKKRRDEAVEPLIERIRDHDIQVQLAAIRALVQIGNEQCEKGLVDALKDDQWEVQALAAQGLGKFKTNLSVSALIHTLHARTGTVRAAAAESLIFVGDSRAVVALYKRLEDKDKSVRENSAKALTAIGTPEALAAVEEWQRKQQNQP